RKPVAPVTTTRFVASRSAITAPVYHSVESGGGQEQPGWATRACCRRTARSSAAPPAASASPIGTTRSASEPVVAIDATGGAVRDAEDGGWEGWGAAGAPATGVPVEGAPCGGVVPCLGWNGFTVEVCALAEAAPSAVAAVSTRTATHQPARRIRITLQGTPLASGQESRRYLV